ncbi:MAG: bifunctional hydroxymethylpyrimidine kinase/phosphomethylpyrimidine kinase [Deltaproteobacteria bacterium]|nr:bifunctional hydroxymethylpyrimidine kinase/phosphomethylpyrimidine kinase [Deltaproteobacteria bacterium]
MGTHQPTHRNDSPRVVLVGGIDPGAGAGALRDLLTASALGARGHVVGTAWTEQGDDFIVEPRAPASVRIALTAALAKVGAAETGVKIGMVASAPVARAVLAALASFCGPVVFDPVVRASSGGRLYDGDRESLLALARRATLLTPNLDEAAWLLDRPVRTEAEARAAGCALCALGIPAVLVKGGHLAGEAADVLVAPAGVTLFSAARVAGPSPRGTGCALATAIAVELARGESLESAVAVAKTWLWQRIERAATVDGERHL